MHFSLYDLQILLINQLYCNIQNSTQKSEEFDHEKKLL